MKKKNVWIGILTCLSTLFFVAGCDEKFTVSPAENTDLLAEKYNSQTAEINDEFVVIDGKVDEEIYQNANWLEFSYASNVEGNLPVIKLTGFTGEKGIYISSIAEDKNVRYGASYMEQIAPASCTSWNFSIVVDKKGEEPNKTRNNWFTYLLDCKGNAVSTKSSRRCTYVDGKLNSDATNFVSCEIFIPWSQFEFAEEERPEDFGILPYYYGCFPSATTTTMFELQPSYGKDRTESYYRFGKVDNDTIGYMTPDEENAVFGNAYSQYPRTPLWDVSKQAEGTVECIGGGYNVIYFQGSYDDSFAVTTTMYPIAGVNDPYPKAGIYMMSTEGWYYTAMLDMQPSWIVDGANDSKTLSKYRIYTLNNNNPDRWDFKAFGQQVENTDFALDEGVEFTLVKHGARFYYFVDDIYMGAEEVASAFAGKVFAGLYSLSMNVVYDDCQYETLTEDEVTEFLNAKNVYSVEASIATAGGTVSTSKFEVSGGGSAEFEFLCKSGYVLSSVTINGTDVTQEVKSNAVGGKFLLTNINENVKLKASFAKVSDGITLSGYTYNYETGEKMVANVFVQSLEDSSLVYSCSSSVAKGYSVELPKGEYKVTYSFDGYTTQKETLKLTEDKEVPAQLMKMSLELPDVAYQTWTMWYDKSMRTVGTNNYTDSYHASGVHFATNSDAIYFAGSFHIDKWAFQGFSISSGNTYIRFMSRAQGFNIWTYNNENGNIVAENTDKNTCLIDDRDAKTTAVKSPATIYPISGSGVQKTWNFVFVILDDVMYIYYDDVLCYEIDLTKYGFTQGSKYNVGIIKPAFFNTTFTVDIDYIMTGEKAEKVVETLLK